jgi:GntR family transcriptional regulator, transcriptional repressor for pyruvate dehydrogenase complex
MLWEFTGTDHHELKDLLEARSLLEQDLAGLAAIRASDFEIKGIGETIETIRSNIAEGQSILEPDMAFHLAIASAAHNDLLCNAVQLLRNMTRQRIYLSSSCRMFRAKWFNNTARFMTLSEIAIRPGAA